MSIKDDIKEQYPVFIDDFEKRAFKRLATQYKESEKMVSTIQAYQKLISDLMDAAFEVLTETWIETAEGINLDNVGAWVGQERISIDNIQVLSDILYRLFIETKILTNISKNVHPDIYAHMTKILERTDFYIESGRARMNIVFVSSQNPAFGYGDNDDGYGVGYYMHYISSGLFAYKWTDAYGHEHTFFPITLGVGREVYVSDGQIFGYGDTDKGYSNGYYLYNILRRVTGPFLGYGTDGASYLNGRYKQYF